MGKRVFSGAGIALGRLLGAIDLVMCVIAFFQYRDWIMLATTPYRLYHNNVTRAIISILSCALQAVPSG